MTPRSKKSTRLAGTLLAGMMLVGAAGCGDGERELTAAEEALMADESYGEETFDGADVGGVMRIDDDTFRLGVVTSDGEKAQLQVLHSTDTSLNETVDVEFRSVFAVGDYRIRVVTVGERSVAVRWAKKQ